MLRDVLEGLLVLLGALRALPQQQPLRAWEVKTAWIGLGLGLRLGLGLGLGLGLRLGLGLGVLTVSQVAALLIRLGALGTLHRERRLAARKPSHCPRLGFGLGLGLGLGLGYCPRRHSNV